MNKKYHTLVFIGRFQPVHNAHAEIIRRASELARQVIIVVGSANQPRTYKNPWTYAERHDMLLMVVNSMIKDPQCMVRIEPVTDSIYNDQAWAIRVQDLVYKHVPNPTSDENYGGYAAKIGIIGHKKDNSSFYLDMFPQWTFEEVEELEPLNASSIRELYFREKFNMNFIHSVVPKPVLIALSNFRQTHYFQQVLDERKFIENYKQQFMHLPYTPVFVTVDAVVIQSGHVLMIKRKAEPGKGLWALPGGFLNADNDRSVKDAMLRELREETGIKVPAPVIAGSIQSVEVFDAIERSSRGRTITHAFKIVLPDGPLPRVKGADDAEKAKWIPIGMIKPEQCFEDHWEIIQHMVGA